MVTTTPELCEQARSETYKLMCRHADGLAANAIVGMRYDSTELMPGLTEVARRPQPGLTHAG